jgi:histone acetyltransferase 1
MRWSIEAFKKPADEFTSNVKAHPTDFTPPGALDGTFTALSTKYDIYRSSLADEATRDYLSNFQILVPLYIEGGTLLDLDDEPWTINRWDIFLLYTTPTPSKPRTFIGYCTLYNNLFFSTTTPELARTRLSQFLILPPFQHQGLGSLFYDHIVAHYLAEPRVKELTVEDPSAAFAELRDLQDYRRLSTDPDFSGLTVQSVFDNSAPLKQLREKHKMPTRQFKRMVELHLATKLNKKNKTEYKRFRLIVKGRIYKQNADVLAQVDQLERVDKLEETYFGVEDEYMGLVERLKKGAQFLEEDAEEGVKESEKKKGKRRASTQGSPPDEKRIRVGGEKA